MQLSIIIPAYNEAERLPRTLSQLDSFFSGGRRDGVRLDEIIVVDDGSSDATASVVEVGHARIPTKLIRFEKNRGKGAAARAGMLAAGSDCCLLYDADSATPAAEIPKLAARMRMHSADVVIGSRARGREDGSVSMQSHRRLIGRFYHILSSALIPGIEDAACGAKLFTRQAAQDLFSRQRIERFAFDIEILSLAMRLGYCVYEMPVRWEAIPGSKVSLVRDSVNMSWCVLKLYVRHLVLRDLGMGSAISPEERETIPLTVADQPSQHRRRAA